MVSMLGTYKSLLRLLLKLVGMKSQIVEIEAGTVMNFWVPTKPTSSKTNKGSAASASPSASASAKPSVLFLHGFGFDGILTWQFQVLALAKEYDIYVPDLIFFGSSSTDKLERSPAFQAECVARGLKKMGVEKCILVGFSYGGMVGFKMAEMYPELVESMVATDTVVALTESISHSSFERIGFSSWPQYLLPDSVKGTKEFLDIAMYKPPPFPNFMLKEALQMILENKKEKVELLEALVVKDEAFKLPKYKQKFCILSGEEDIIFDVNAVNTMKSQLGENTELQYVKKAGHSPSLERPFLYNKLLKGILRRLAENTTSLANN